MSTQEQGAGGLVVEGLPEWQVARRQRIIAAGLRALAEQEYEKIQIRDVAQAAEVALGTLYRYFSSKEHLYAAVLHEWAAFDRVRRARKDQFTTEERVRRRAHAVVRAFQKQPQFFKVHVLLQTSADPNARQLMAEFARTAQASLAGEFDIVSAQEAAGLAIMLWSIINTMVTHAVYHGGKMTEVHRIVDGFVDLAAPRLR